MKTLGRMAGLVAITLFCSCGMSEDQKMKKIEKASEEYANRFCNKTKNENMARPMYDMQFDYMLENLRMQGLENRSTIRIATNLYEKKVKEMCGPKFPKEYKDR
ncbi:MAG TPA: hypothetical protein VK177_20385 [Flavobacteriales bacterium]|nr:hypothetical protein [Flavobacteriales bacterium]